MSIGMRPPVVIGGNVCACRAGESHMPYVITDPCIGTKDTACVDVCPVDCIHPRQDEVEFPGTRVLFIHPHECIDCGACIPACPVAAIYDSVDSTPASQHMLVAANAVYRSGDEQALRTAEALVDSHIEANPDLMAIDPSARAAAHLQRA
jgi:ferredoxin